MSIGRFQCGIAALIYHPASKTYLLLQRAAHRDFGGAEWECVTGRVDQGESYEQALHREVREELGVMVTLEFIIGTTHFYRGAPLPENELLGVKYACLLEDQTAIQVSDEHSEVRWLTAEEVYALLPSQHWLHQTIRRAELMRRSLPPELLDVFRSEGFETL
jgi:8-oxo-dGTP diphosphatase